MTRLHFWWDDELQSSSSSKKRPYLMVTTPGFSVIQPKMYVWLLNYSLIIKLIRFSYECTLLVGQMLVDWSSLLVFD